MARRTYCLLVLSSLVLSAAPAWSQQAGGGDSPRKDSIRTVSLVVDPKPEPTYALAYRLETPYMEQRPGNGALLYQTALSLIPEIKRKYPALDDKVEGWYDSPLDKLPQDEVREIITRFKQPIRTLDLATRCERCTWEYSTREEGLNSAMPVWGDMRILMRVLALKARLEMADGKVAEAIETLRISLSAARDLGNGPFIIQNLVGIGSAGRVLQEVERVIQSPGAPNLYWALTDLPHPLISMRQALQMETDAAYAGLPELRRLDDEVLSNDQVVRLWNKAAATFSSGDYGTMEKTLAHTMMMASALKLYPVAKQHLLDQGKTAQEVESLPDLYVVLVYQHDRCRRLADSMLKWCDVPYWQAEAGLMESEKLVNEEMDRIRQDMDVVMAVFDYGMGNRFRWIYFLNTRLERDLAMLRCVEAIRMYAAGHDGKLPQALSDITEVPIPLDPVYGQAFSYQVADGKAVLESPAPSDQSARHGLRYEIAIRHQTK
jgi:hypothetical protein